MLIDDQMIVERLESNAYGALVRVLSIAADSLSIDLAAGRLFQTHPDLSLTAHMDLGTIRFPPQREDELRQWPMRRDSIFAVVEERRHTDAAFRPRQLLDEASFAKTDQFRTMEPYARVVDSFCITCPLHAQAWAMVIFMRCSPHRPFDDVQITILTRLKSTIARVLRDGYQRDIQHAPSESARDLARGLLPVGESRVHRPPHTPQTLSQTEQQILAMLIEGMTEKQIAERMDRSPHTTHVHVRNIYRKTAVTSRRELKQYFSGLSSPGDDKE